jgi:flagellin-like hook-associated protein FlgL
MSNEQAGIGVQQQFLTESQTTLASVQTALTTQVSNVENVDAAATATALTQAQQQLQISYKLIASMQSLSLVNYI